MAGAIWDALEFSGLAHVYSMDYLQPLRARTGVPAGLPIVWKIMFNTTHSDDSSVELKRQFRWSAARSWDWIQGWDM